MADEAAAALDIISCDGFSDTTGVEDDDARDAARSALAFAFTNRARAFSVYPR